MAPNTSDTVGTLTVIVGAMLLIALIEVAIPLHSRGRISRTHIAPNLALTAITFATNAVFNLGLVTLLIWFQSLGLGLLNGLSISPLVATAIAVVVLDFSFYVTHVAMHRMPLLWRYHRVHHSDPMVDVTTTIRQHPGESVIRYAALVIASLALGASPAAFAVYRSWSALNGLLEHANIRVPPRFDWIMSLVTTWPNMHKVHHSRRPHETDTNYGNIFSFWDRMFFTFTPSHRGASIPYGLDEFDDARSQTISGLLAMPFRTEDRAARGAAPRTVEP